MEPNKLDNEFKKKLEQRTIQPSDMAWDRLDAMLSVTEKKKPNRTWMYMAAGFLGLLLTGTLFLKLESADNEVINNDETIVHSTVPQNDQKEDDAVAVPVIISSKVAAQQNTVVATQEKTSKKAVKYNKPVIDTAIETADKDMQVATITGEKNSPDKTEVTAESESLLAATLPTPKKKPLIKVDANSLLSSVEGELNESFRKKVLQTVTKNYNVIKTSIANRNYQ